MTEEGTAGMANGIAVIDISCSWEDGGDAKEDLVMKMYSDVRGALTTSGFFFVKGHRVSTESMEGAMQCTRDFFRLESDIKEKYMPNKAAGDPPLGYSGKTIFLDPTMQSKPDTREQYKVGNDGYDKAYKTRCSSEIRSVSPPDKAFYWPEEEIRAGKIQSNFKHVLSNYFDDMRLLGHQLMKVICAALCIEYKPVFDDDENANESCFDRPMHLLSMLRYDGTISDVSASLFGCGPHTDYGCLTILQLDPVVGGLEVFIENQNGNADHTKENSWLEINPVEGCFVVNAGEMLERWTNGIVKASLHRVVSKSNTPRYSIPFFFEPNIDCNIGPLKSCLKTEDKKYETIKVRTQNEKL